MPPSNSFWGRSLECQLQAALWILPYLSKFLDHIEMPPGVGAWVFGFLVLLLVILPLSSASLAWLRARLGYSRLTVTSHDLTVVEQGILRKKSTRLELSEVLDIDYEGARRGQLQARLKTTSSGESHYPEDP